MLIDNLVQQLGVMVLLNPKSFLHEDWIDPIFLPNFL